MSPKLGTIVHYVHADYMHRLQCRAALVCGAYGTQPYLDVFWAGANDGKLTTPVTTLQGVSEDDTAATDNSWHAASTCPHGV